MSVGDKPAPKILIVDDTAANRMLLAKVLRENTEYELMLAADAGSVLSLIEEDLPDLILLDIMMPEMDGYELARRLKKIESTKDIPILYITAVSDIEGMSEAYEAGGVDYITKPFNKTELLARVRAHMDLKRMQDELKEKNALLADRELHLTKLVEEQTLKLEQTTLSLVNALENVNLYNDTDTGNHIRRVSEYSALLAEQFGMDRDFVKRIRTYASLHDVGKVGLPDTLLKKPGQFSKEEFVRMQNHVSLGARMLDDPQIDPMAKNIALYHHEKWNGSGYVSGLAGEDIPIEARIVALADVYDALGTKRTYKDAFPEETIHSIIMKDSGTHFDPALIATYDRIHDEFIGIKQRVG
jgi:putative two-component system response regulator